MSTHVSSVVSSTLTTLVGDHAQGHGGCLIRVEEVTPQEAANSKRLHPTPFIIQEGNRFFLLTFVREDYVPQ